jgi:hypothetical protein
MLGALSYLSRRQMNNFLFNLALLPLAVLMYGSGLLLWPIRRWRHGKKEIRGRWLGFVSIAQIIAYAVTACCSAFIRLDHFYDWFIFLIELNILFTLIGIVAWSHDNYLEQTKSRKPSN